jgi:uncharacterized protein involved in exopolysaccharide biosynthesis|tara:strand:- start:27144 stop:27371 length:228 start_codon:yes stop_codon:yes gene_type:complete
MESITLTSLVSIVAVLTFMYSYIKDRYESGKAIGQLEQRVTSLEDDKQKIQDLINSVSEIQIQLARLEQKIDMRQ